ncbi:30S ribosomal protein S20, partial [Patescibacteria group bacterium]|nr:30S ribosomal protein S20 [Patescibacteria group bacterium]
AKELVMKTMKALDKAAQKGIIKKNTRDRKKSRLQKKFNQASKV